MAKFKALMASQAGPGIISVLLLLAMAAVDPMLIAAPLGGGLGILANPVTVAIIALTAAAADGWRPALLGTSLAAIFGNTIGVHPLEDEPTGWRIAMILGTLFVGSIIVAIFGGLKMLFRQSRVVK